MNSFDQWGVELGKVLGVKVRKYLSQARSGGRVGPVGTIEPMLNCDEMWTGGGDVSGFQKPTQQLDFCSPRGWLGFQQFEKKSKFICHLYAICMFADTAGPLRVNI